MRGQSCNYRRSSRGRIRLHASISEETKTMHIISSRNSTLSIAIKVYLWLSLWSLSNEVFFTAWTWHWTTGSSVKLITLAQNAPGIYDMSDLFCFV